MSAADAVDGGARRGQRPSGLTTLAVLNFLIGAAQILGALGVLAAGAALSAPLRQALFVVGLVTGALLILSGFGYLRQRRRLGLWIGLVYCGAGIAGQVTVAILSPRELGLGVVIGLFYPLFTAFLLLAIFRRDFAR